MTPKQTKILIYTLGSIVGAVAITYGVCSLIILHNYSQTLSVQEAATTLDNAVLNAEPIIVQPADNTADVSTGSTMGNDDPNLVIDNNSNQ
jgi:hypothetical protein